MRAEPGQPVAMRAWLRTVPVLMVLKAAPPRVVENVNVRADGLDRTKKGVPVGSVAVDAMAGLPVVMKQKELPIVKGCATAIVTVLPPTMLDAMLRASPVTSGPDATVPWADAEPRFAAELTVKVVTDGTLVMGHGALYDGVTVPPA
jgi:hypothetical protein